MRSLAVLGNGSFRNLWLAGQLSVLGMQVGRIGLMLHLFEDQGSVVNLALLVLLETLPGALAAPLAGAAVDRRNKASVLVGADLARAALMAGLVLYPSLLAIYAAAALNSVLSAFFQPAKAAALPLVLSDDELVEGNGLDQAASNVMLILGPVIGAHLLLGFGLTATLLFDAAAFLLSAVFAARVSTRMVSVDTARRHWRAMVEEIRDGWGYLAGHGLALHLTLLLFTALVCTGVWAPLAPFFIRDHLGASEELLGWQLSAFGAGAVLGGLLAPRLVHRYGAGPVLYGAFLAEGVSLAAYALAQRLDLSTFIIFCWGVVVSTLVVPFYSILQRVVEERFLGRVFSVVKQGEDAALVLSMLAVVLLQGTVPSRAILLLMGAVYAVVITLSGLTRSGRRLLVT